MGIKPITNEELINKLHVLSVYHREVIKPSKICTKVNEVLEQYSVPDDKIWSQVLNETEL
jgi:hypothetical protein